MGVPGYVDDAEELLSLADSQIGCFIICLQGEGMDRNGLSREVSCETILERGIKYHKEIKECEYQSIKGAVRRYAGTQSERIALRYGILNMIQMLDKVFLLAANCGRQDIKTEYDEIKQQLFVWRNQQTSGSFPAHWSVYGGVWRTMEDKYAFLDPMDKAWEDIMEGLRKTEQEWGAPFYIFHKNLFIRNLNLLREHLGGDVDIAFAMKANPWLAPAAAEVADYIEVSTDGELKMCRAYGILGSRITLDGVLRTEAMLRDALDMGVRRFGIDSVDQARQIIGLCDELCAAGKLGEDSVKLLLRLSSGGRFGMGTEEAAQCFKTCGESKHARIVGIHYYSGTQRSEAGKLKRELEYFRQTLNSLCELPGAAIYEIQFGCGLGFHIFLKKSERDMRLLWMKPQGLHIS